MSKSSHDPLKYYKLHPDAKDPFFATKGSACFDLHACLSGVERYKVRQDTLDREIERPLKNGSLQIFSMERVLVPTGLILDIPEGYSVRLHSRSGLVYNHGLYLTNCEGIIDWDYVDPVFIIMTNISQSPKTINNGDRICQGELVEKIYHGFKHIKKPPTQKTERDGGFGSTGT